MDLYSLQAKFHCLDEALSHAFQGVTYGYCIIHRVIQQQQ